MPELNLTNPRLQDILFRRNDSVLQRYLTMGIDGWRFDVAMDVGMPVSREIRSVLENRFSDIVMIGEVLNYAEEWTKGQDVYHGVMNYYFHDAIFTWLQGRISSRQLNETVNDYFTGYGRVGALCSWNILTSHDTARLRYLLTDPEQRKLAVAAQFTLPGVPFIYYGEEIGMEGGPDPDCRRLMIWDQNRWDTDTLAWYKKLVKIRQSRRELRSGDLTVLGDRLNGDALVFMRYTAKPDEVAIVAINRGENTLREVLFTPHSHLYHSLPLKNLLAPKEATKLMQAGNLELEIAPASAAIYVPDDTQYEHYKFYQSRNI